LCDTCSECILLRYVIGLIVSERFFFYQPKICRIKISLAHSHTWWSSNTKSSAADFVEEKKSRSVQLFNKVILSMRKLVWLPHACACFQRTTKKERYSRADESFVFNSKTNGTEQTTSLGKTTTDWKCKKQIEKVSLVCECESAKERK
jgi:hypothetical protein